MNNPSPAEGVVRQLRKTVDERRRHGDECVEQELADILAVVETAERLNLRTPVLDVETHEKLRSILDSIGHARPRTRNRLISRRKGKARTQLPIADGSGQLTLPLGDGDG